jgi:ATP-binding protein involved in chromosome partitioning
MNNKVDMQEEKKIEEKNTNIEGESRQKGKIKNVIAVMSGKGGVGKSFVTSLLATALAKKEYQVGILDADITGPSIPSFFGLNGPVYSERKQLKPLQSRLGIKVMSMNLLLPSPDQPIVWRGPMISKAINQLWDDVVWGELDYLLIDLPPGTSDAALTIMRSLPIDGIIMVTTPQNLSSMIVRKAVNMSKKLEVNVLGVIENMAYYICPECNSCQQIFGKSHADEVAKAANTSLLAKLPISPDIAELCDKGKIESNEYEEINEAVEQLILNNSTVKSMG